MIIENCLDLSLNALADAMTHCFEGYIMPAHFTGPMEAAMIRADAVDLASSLVATIDSEIVGTALIARRGKICRLAAMAVARSARRKGVGKAILDRAIEDAKARGETQMVLEVIEQNPPAIELYKRSGFEIQHRLIGFEGTLHERGEDQPSLIGSGSFVTKKRPASKAVLKDCTFSEVAATLRQRGFLASSWSMSPATVEQLSGPSRAVKCGEVFAVVAVTGEEAVACRSLGFARTPSREAVLKWLEAMVTTYPGKKLYLPAFFPEPEYQDAFTDTGMKISEISQFQMSRDLTA